MGLALTIKAGDPADRTGSSVRFEDRETGFVLGRVWISEAKARAQTSVVMDFVGDVTIIHERENERRPEIGTRSAQWR